MPSHPAVCSLSSVTARAPAPRAGPAAIRAAAAAYSLPRRRRLVAQPENNLGALAANLGEARRGEATGGGLHCIEEERVPAVPLYSGEVGPRAHQPRPPRRGRLDARAPADPIHTGRPKALGFARALLSALLCSPSIGWCVVDARRTWAAAAAAVAMNPLTMHERCGSFGMATVSGGI